MCIAILSIIANVWQQPRCFSVGEQIMEQIQQCKQMSYQGKKRRGRNLNVYY
jgi:hypothetical protein